MSTKTYTVRTKYVVDSNSAEKRALRLARGAERYAKEAERAEKATRGWGGSLKALATGAAGGALGWIAKKFLDVQRSASNAQIQIAGVFSALNPGSNFLDNIKRGADLMDRFRESSIKSPATSAEFQQVFGGAAPALGGMGLSNKTITQFIARAVPASMAFAGGDFEQTGRDVNQLLSGNFGTDNRTFNPVRKELFALTGAKDTQQFNKLAKQDPRKVFESTMEVLKSMDEVNKMFGQTFDGLLSSTIEYTRQAGKSFTDEVYEKIKGQLAMLVGWFERNRAEIDRVARIAGSYLARGFELAAAGARLLLDHMKGIAALATVLAAKKMGGMLMGGAGGGIASGVANYVAGGAAIGGKAAGAIGAAPGAAIWGLARRGGLYDRARALPARGRAGIERFRSAGAGVLNRNGGTISGVLGAGVKRGAVGVFKGLGGALKFMAVGAVKLFAILAPLVVVVGMVAGTFRVLKDRANDATAFLNTSIDELLLALDMIAIQFGGGGGFVKSVTEFVDWLGTGVVGVFGIAVKAVEQLVRAVSWMGAVFKGIGLAIGTIANAYDKGGLRAAFDSDLISNAFSSGMEKAMKERAAAEKKAWEMRRKRELEKKKKFEDEEREKQKKNLKNAKTNVKVTINQDIKTDADPDRIAFKTGEAMKSVKLHDRNTSAPLLPGLNR